MNPTIKLPQAYGVVSGHQPSNQKKDLLQPSGGPSNHNSLFLDSKPTRRRHLPIQVRSPIALKLIKFDTRYIVLLLRREDEKSYSYVANRHCLPAGPYLLPCEKWSRGILLHMHNNRHQEFVGYDHLLDYRYFAWTHIQTNPCSSNS